MTLLPLFLLNTSYLVLSGYQERLGQNWREIRSMKHKPQKHSAHWIPSIHWVKPRPGQYQWAVMVAGPAQDWPMITIIGPNLEKTDLSNYPGSSNQTEHHHHTCVLLPPCHYFYIKLDLNPPPQIGLLLIWLASNVIGRSDWAMSFFSTFLLLRVSIYFPNPDNVRNHLDKVQNIQRQWTKTQSRYLHSLLSILSLTGQGYQGYGGSELRHKNTDTARDNNRKCCSDSRVHGLRGETQPAERRSVLFKHTPLEPVSVSNFRVSG